MGEGGGRGGQTCIYKKEKKKGTGVEAFCIVTYAERVGGLAGATNKTAKTADAQIKFLFIFILSYALMKIVNCLPAERIEVMKFHVKSKKKE